MVHTVNELSIFYFSPQKDTPKNSILMKKLIIFDISNLTGI